MRYYFAYGSNLLPEQMRKRCGDAVQVGAATLEGWRFLINPRGVATLREEAGSVCHGGVWRLSPADERSLDAYEGVGAGCYGKATFPVQLYRGDCVEALTYLDHRHQHGTPRHGYLEKVLFGARHFGLPDDYLIELAGWGAERRKK